MRSRRKASVLLARIKQDAERDDTIDSLLDYTKSDMAGRQIGGTKKHKFNVSSREARTSCGVVFDSKWEMQVYDMLRSSIPKNHLHLQPSFVLQEKFRGPDGKMQRAILYVGDFLLGPPRLADDDPLLPEHVVIDCKGMETDVFRLKLKLFMRRYGVVIHRPRTNQQAKVHDIIQAYLKTCNS